MEDPDKNRWDVITNIGTPVVALLGVLFTVWVGLLQFNHGEKNKVALESKSQLLKDQIEFQRKLWLDRVDAYHRMADITGEIATSVDDPRAFKQAEKKFLSVYWGLMILVEDHDVSMKMQDLRFTLLQFDDHYADANLVRAKVAELNEACQNSISQRRNVIEDQAMAGDSGQQQPSAIHVLSAQFGRNCKEGSTQGDLSDLVGSACEGQTNCSYSLSGTNHTHGDMCPGVKKDFDWSWSCSGQRGHKEGHIDGPADNAIADLYCPI